VSSPLVGRTNPTATDEQPAVRLERTAGRRSLGKLRSRLWPFVLIAPFFVGFAVFQLYPIGFSVWLSLREWSFNGTSRWVGLHNFREAFHDPVWTQSLTNVLLIFIVYVPLMIVLATILAVLLNSSYVRAQGIWRTIIFLPFIMSGTVSAAFAFRLLFDTSSGYANTLLSFIHVSPVPWLDDPTWSRISIGIVVLWAGLGYNMLLLLAGVQAIPKDLAEAARVDGAGPVRIFLRITVPLLRPVLVFVLTLSIIGTFQLFVEPFIITQGAPANSTMAPVYEIYNNTFIFGRVGYAAAESVILVGIIVLVAVTQFVLISRRDSYLERM
jgi:ABC-type sugar transport system permease subunit